MTAKTVEEASPICQCGDALNEHGDRAIRGCDHAVLAGTKFLPSNGWAPGAWVDAYEYCACNGYVAA